MLDVKLSLAAIDWQSSIDAIFPMVMNKLQSSEKQSLPVKILKNSGSELPQAVKNILNMLSDAEKLAFIEWASASYESKIISLIDNVLKKKGFEDSVSVQGIRIGGDAASKSLEVNITGLTVDYANEAIRSFIRNKLSVDLPAGLTGFLGRTAQGAVVKLLASKTISEKICSFAESKLREKGISAKVTDCKIVNHSANTNEAASTGKRPMSDGLEECALRVTGRIIGQLAK